MTRLGLGTAGLFLSPRTSFAGTPMTSHRLADLALRIRETPRAKIFDLVVDAIGHGAKPKHVLGATFLAGVHDVEPRPVGGNLHSVMSVEASYRLVETAASAEEAWLVALWNLDSFKDTQQERGDPWVLPPAPKVSFNSETEARQELIAALDTWDEERADRAVVGLLPFHDRESLYEILWPYTARCMAYLGHKIVYGAMTEAVLRRIEWSHAEPTVRSLVYGLVGPGREGPVVRAYEHAVGVADSFPAGWLDNRRTDPSESLALYRTLMTGSYQDAQKAVIEAARDGLAPGTIWDAIRLGAWELWLRRQSDDPESGAAIRAVHTVTETWSLRHAWRNTKSDRTRRLLILQAAAWVPEFRDALLVRKAVSMDGPGIESLGDGVEDVPSDLEELLEVGDPAVARRFLERRPELAPVYLERLRRQLAAKGVEYHQHKCVAAIEDEMSTANPRWVPSLLAPAVSYLPSHKAVDSNLATRSREALRAARVLS